MRRLILAAAALLPASAQAVPVQYHCTGAREGEAGEQVTVTRYFSADGRSEGQSAAWDPPARADTAKAASAPDLALALIYAAPTADGPGASSGATVIATAFAPPGTRGAGKVLRMLDGSRAELSANGGSPTLLPLEHDARIADLPMTAMRFAALDPLPGTTRELAVRLLDRRGKALTEVRFDLSDTARRDALYREAWARAEEAGRDPATCPAAEE